jgi:hypothetical protein
VHHPSGVANSGVISVVASLFFGVTTHALAQPYDPWALGSPAAVEAKALLATTAQSTARLASAYDSAPDGDGLTRFAVVDLTGITVPFTEVRLLSTDLRTTAPSSGVWRLSGVALQDGRNDFLIEFDDGFSEPAVLTLTIERIPAVSAPNVALQWNAEALDVVRKERPSPPAVSRHLAILHLAMHDAARSASSEQEQTAAVSAAAHRYLTQVFPAQKSELDVWLAESLSGIPDDLFAPARARGVALADAWIVGVRGRKTGLGLG